MGCTSIQPESFYSLSEEVALCGGVGIGERGTELGREGQNWGGVGIGEKGREVGE